VSKRDLGVVVGAQHVWITTRQSKWREGLGEIAHLLPVPVSFCPGGGLPNGNDVHHKVLLAETKSGRIAGNAGGGSPEMMPGDER
jgi:hypothetical protein